MICAGGGEATGMYRSKVKYLRKAGVQAWRQTAARPK
jgi:hypothetical protein